MCKCPQTHHLDSGVCLPKLVVEFMDGDGNVTERHEVATESVTQEEIDDAVALIHGGCDARTAMMLAKQGRPPDDFK